MFCVSCKQRVRTAALVDFLVEQRAGGIVLLIILGRVPAEGRGIVLHGEVPGGTGDIHFGEAAKLAVVVIQPVAVAGRNPACC